MRQVEMAAICLLRNMPDCRQTSALSVTSKKPFKELLFRNELGASLHCLLESLDPPLTVLTLGSIFGLQSVDLSRTPHVQICM